MEKCYLSMTRAILLTTDPARCTGHSVIETLPARSAGVLHFCTGSTGSPRREASLFVLDAEGDDLLATASSVRTSLGRSTAKAFYEVGPTMTTHITQLSKSLRDGVKAEIGAYPEGTPPSSVPLSVSSDTILKLLDVVEAAERCIELLSFNFGGSPGPNGATNPQLEARDWLKKKLEELRG